MENPRKVLRQTVSSSSINHNGTASLNSSSLSTIFATCSGDKIQVWNLSNTSTPISQFSPHEGKINSVAWNHSNQVIASGGDDGKIILSSISGKLMTSFFDEATESSPVLCLAFSSGSRYLCSGGADHFIRVWDLKHKKLIRTFKDHTSPVVSVKFNTSDSQIASSSQNGTVLLHSSERGQLLASYPTVANQTAKEIAFSPLRKYLLSACSDDGSVFIWNTSSKHSNEVQKFKQHRASVNGIAFSPINETLLVSAGLDKQIILYDLHRNTISSHIIAEEELTAISFSPSGYVLVAGTSNGNIWIFEINKLNQKPRIIKTNTGAPIYCLQFQNISKSTSSSTSSSDRSPNQSLILDSNQQVLINPTPSTKVEPKRAVSTTNQRPKSPLKEQEVELFSPINSQRSRSVTQFNLKHPSRTNASLDSSSQVTTSTYSSSSLNLPSQQSESSNISSTRNSSPPFSKKESNPTSSIEPNLPSIATPPHLSPITPTSSSRQPFSHTWATPSKKGDQSQVFSTNPYPSNNFPSSPMNKISSPFTNGFASPSLARDPSAQTERFQRELLQNIMQETLESFRESIRQEIQNLHLELLNQFQAQQNELQALFEKYFTNRQLLEELEQLRIENLRLKNSY